MMLGQDDARLLLSKRVFFRGAIENLAIVSRVGCYEMVHLMRYKLPCPHIGWHGRPLALVVEEIRVRLVENSEGRQFFLHGT